MTPLPCGIFHLFLAVQLVLLFFFLFFLEEPYNPGSEVFVNTCLIEQYVSQAHRSKCGVLHFSDVNSYFLRACMQNILVNIVLLFLSSGQSDKVFVNYSIYKGKAALTISPKAPEFSPIDVVFSFGLFFYCSLFHSIFKIYSILRSQAGLYKVAKEGCVFLQFAPAAGNRQFDWSRKQVCFQLKYTSFLKKKYSSVYSEMFLLVRLQIALVSCRSK